MNNQSTTAMMHQAQGLFEQNRLSEAREIYQIVCEQDKDNANAWMMLGNMHGALGNITEAETCCKKAIELDPKLVSAHANLGNALVAQNRHEEAAAAFEKATIIQPDLAPAWFMLGKAQMMQAHWKEAELAFHKAIELNSGWLDAHLLLGNVLQNTERYQEACEQYESIIQIQPDFAEAHYRLAASFASMEFPDKAEASCRKALDLQPDHLSALNTMSMILSAQGKTDEALQFCERVLAIRPDDINAACVASHNHELMGDAHKAYEYLRKHVEAGTQQLNLALAFAAVAKELGLHNQAITMMENLLDSSTSLTNVARRKLYFLLGKLCDGSQQYDRAFAHYRRGNELRQTQFNMLNQKARIEASIKTQTTEFFNKTARSSNKSERPVFIVGMPRSGTTLVEQILNSHPDVYGAGELVEIAIMSRELQESLNSTTRYPEILASIDQKTLDQCAQRYLDHLNEKETASSRVVDKLPGNFFHLGFIQLLFPNARVIHCTRNPLDSCLSCYFQDFLQNLDWCFDLDNITSYYFGYEKLMKHWQTVLSIPIINVSYEELVSDQEKVSRQLIDFCGLEWNDDCLNFHKTKRFVSTASYDQVRKPIYKKSVARWKNYQSHIEPFIKAFGSS